jgi:hypothetical protein
MRAVRTILIASVILSAIACLSAAIYMGLARDNGTAAFTWFCGAACGFITAGVMHNTLRRD